MLDYIMAVFKCLDAQIKWFRTGKKYSEPATVLERLEKCVPCEYNKQSRCTVCKCPIMAKVTMESEFCPIDRWK